MTHFTYLGTVISYNEPGTSGKELDRRIGQANSKFAELKKLLCNYHLSLNIQMKFYNTYVRSRLCYCCETWALTNSQYKRVEAVHTQFLRRIVRGGMARMSSQKEIDEAKALEKSGDNSGIENINWAWKNTNERILMVCKTKQIEHYIRNQNVKWIAHVVRASNETNVCG